MPARGLAALGLAAALVPSTPLSAMFGSPSVGPVSAFVDPVQEPVVYGCPSHPEVQSSTPGPCPKCDRPMVIQPPKRPEVVSPGDAYTCPMHLDVRTARPGRCPRCDMALVPAVPAVPQDFDLRMQALPRAIRPGQKVRLRFAVFNPETGQPVRQFGVLHEKLFHLFIVSQDLAEFQHIHPSLEADGSFVIDTVLPRAGHYKVYSDFYPLEGAPQVIQRGLTTAGYRGDLFASQARLVPDRVLTKTVDGMTVELKLDPPEPVGGRTVTLRYRLTDAAGAPVRDLTPYLGAWGHTLILSEDQADYVHSHPLETVPEATSGVGPRGGPEVTFEALLPRPGIYRIWSQFARGAGEPSTVSFTIEARPVTVR